MAEKMGGYIAKYGFSCLEKNMTRFEAERAFQLAPAPPKADNINEYIVQANREQNLLYLCFYLHHIEKIRMAGSTDFSTGRECMLTTRFVCWTTS